MTRRHSRSDHAPLGVPAWSGVRRSFIILALLLAASLARPATAQQTPGQLADQVLLHAHEATAIAEGGGHRVVDIFFDPNCPYCRQLYSDLRAWVGKDDLQFRWIAVAILAPSSLPKAAAILQAPDRLQAFRATEDHGLNPNANPGIAPARVVTPRTRKALAANEALLQRAGIDSAVPLMVFRDKAGKGQLFIGAPKSDTELAALLATVR